MRGNDSYCGAIFIFLSIPYLADRRSRNVNEIMFSNNIQNATNVVLRTGTYEVLNEIRCVGPIFDVSSDDVIIIPLYYVLECTTRNEILKGLNFFKWKMKE